MNAIEELVEKLARTIRALSKAMDARSAALKAWAESKTKATVDAYRISDAEFNKAAAEVLRLRIEIAKSQHERNLDERFSPLPANRKLARR
jgi:hypothetical protein